MQPGDVHLNISSPGLGQARLEQRLRAVERGGDLLVLNYARFSRRGAARARSAPAGVTTLCAPPTVWRMLIQADLGQRRHRRAARVRGGGRAAEPGGHRAGPQAWGITIRDGFGQTETTAQIGNTPGQPVRPGSMGRPLPGYEVALRRPGHRRAGQGGRDLPATCRRRPLGLMTGYQDDPARTRRPCGAATTTPATSRPGTTTGTSPTSAVTDDVFKASDYRISPFELESLLIEHEAVAEAAVVPSPDPVRLAVPKAYVVLAAASEPSPELAGSILAFCRERLAPYKRVRRLEFADLPKTISGKIRRVELRGLETSGRDNPRRHRVLGRRFQLVNPRPRGPPRYPRPAAAMASGRS